MALGIIFLLLGGIVFLWMVTGSREADFGFFDLKIWED
jgi:hypothetical protein